MLTTLVVIVALLLASVLSMVVWGGLLRLGLRWAKAESPSWKRLALAAIVCEGLLPLLLLPLALALGDGARVVLLLFLVIVRVLLIRGIFHLRLGQASRAWLPTLLTVVCYFTFAAGVLRPFVMEAFTAPTNSMAPTLLGQHWTGKCRHCGGPTYATPEDFAVSEVLTICRDCFQTTPDLQIDQTVERGDRFLVCKFLAPRRWDLIVFRYPEDPSVLYVKRLVGLPGETIEIADGKVWANGRELQPPEELRGLAYASEMEIPWPLSGTRANPARLGPDEYFVLGDFSLRAKDSRLWQRGVPGHPPYAVPRSSVYGVVTHIYWPPARMRVFR